jgi:fido (protein-threonine AMPylation protein)
MEDLMEHHRWWCQVSARARSGRARAHAMFAAQTNALEGEPTLSVGSTLELAHQLRCSPIHAHQEVCNTYRAHRLAHAFRAEQGAPLALWTVPQLLEVHRQTMTGLGGTAPAGRFRCGDSWAAGAEHAYPPPELVQSLTWSFVDRLNDRLLRIGGGAEAPAHASAATDDDQLDRGHCDELIAGDTRPVAFRALPDDAVRAVVATAAWGLRTLLVIHPFADGNGRVARILADCILAAVHPVPVPLMTSSDVARSRAEYLRALRRDAPGGYDVAAHFEDAEGTGAAEMASLMVRAMQRSWVRIRAAAMIAPRAPGRPGAPSRSEPGTPPPPDRRKTAST